MLDVLMINLVFALFVYEQMLCCDFSVIICCFVICCVIVCCVWLDCLLFLKYLCGDVYYC